MQMLILQTLGLLVGAYFIGAFFGCLIRRVFFAGRSRKDPAPIVVVPPAADDAVTKRFVDALEAPVATAAKVAETVAAAPVVAASATSALAAAPATAAFAAGTLPSAGSSTGQGSVAAAIAMAAVPATPADDLTLIRAIDADMQKKLAALGVTRFAEIAAWRAADVAKVASALGIKGRIASENWVEQAQILAKGGLTRYARELDGRIALAAPSADEGAPKPMAPTPPRVEERAAFAGTAASDSAASAAATAAAVAAAAAQMARTDDRLGQASGQGIGQGLGRDDLKRIAGVNSEIEKLLNAQGITRFSQIAAWKAGDAARIDGLLGREGRVASETWIEQAQILTRGGATAYSREKDRQDDVIRPARLLDAIREPATTAATAAGPGDSGGAGAGEGDVRDLSVLRSVRSEIYRGGDLGPRPDIDDLKRIRGIGVLIEKRLASLGVTSYEQIANWSASDVDRVSEVLDFKGRIERESWVEQARILASGGQTEFSRRVDRGEVETSR